MTYKKVEANLQGQKHFINYIAYFRVRIWLMWRLADFQVTTVLSTALVNDSDVFHKFSARRFQTSMIYSFNALFRTI